MNSLSAPALSLVVLTIVVVGSSQLPQADGIRMPPVVSFDTDKQNYGSFYNSANTVNIDGRFYCDTKEKGQYRLYVGVYDPSGNLFYSNTHSYYTCKANQIKFSDGFDFDRSSKNGVYQIIARHVDNMHVETISYDNRHPTHGVKPFESGTFVMEQPHNKTLFLPYNITRGWDLDNAQFSAAENFAKFTIDQDNSNLTQTKKKLLRIQIPVWEDMGDRSRERVTNPTWTFDLASSTTGVGLGLPVPYDRFKVLHHKQEGTILEIEIPEDTPRDISVQWKLENPVALKTPLEQVSSGILSEQVVCRQGYFLIQKYDGSPACVKPETKRELIKRDWHNGNQTTTEYSVLNKQSAKPNVLSAKLLQNENIPQDSITLEEIESIPDTLNKVVRGADKCVTRTTTCKITGGVSLVRQFPFGMLSDSGTYSISITQNQKEILLDAIPWKTKPYTYDTILHDGKHYVVMLNVHSGTTPDVKMHIAEPTVNDPIQLKRGQEVRYILFLKSWATYGEPATIKLDAFQSAKDSGIEVDVKPRVFEIQERSNATADLVIRANEDAKDGVYQIRLAGKANGDNAGLHCGNMSCPVVRIDDSDWHIRTFSSGSMSIGGIKPSQGNEWGKIELNKKELFEGDIAQIRAFVVNNGSKPIVLEESIELLIKVIKADSTKGYYDSLYSIHARYESDKPLVIEPGTKTLLARPFYWDQITFDNSGDGHRLDPSTRKLTMAISAANHTWNDELWFEIK